MLEIQSKRTHVLMIDAASFANADKNPALACELNAEACRFGEVDARRLDEQVVKSSVRPDGAKVYVKTVCI